MREKIIFITGGTSGIGKRLALDYLMEGNKVIVTGRSMDKVTDLSEKFSESFFPMEMDVTDRSGMVSLLIESKKNSVKSIS